MGRKVRVDLLAVRGGRMKMTQNTVPIILKKFLKIHFKKMIIYLPQIVMMIS